MSLYEYEKGMQESVKELGPFMVQGARQKNPWLAEWFVVVGIITTRSTGVSDTILNKLRKKHGEKLDGLFIYASQEHKLRQPPEGYYFFLPLYPLLQSDVDKLPQDLRNALQPYVTKEWMNTTTQK